MTIELDEIVVTPGTPDQSSPGVSGIDRRIVEQTQQQKLIFPHDRPKYFTYLAVSTYSRQNLMSMGNLKHEMSMILPLPLNMIDRHQVAYQEKAIGMGMGSTISGIMGDVYASEQAAGGAARGVAGTIANNPQAAGRVAARLVGGAVAAPAAAAISGLGNLTGALPAAQAAWGFSPNEYYTILLKGPMYKRHSLKFKLAPNSFQETVTVRKIINKLNNFMAPSLSWGSFLWFWPKVFHIAYMPNPGYLMKFKPAALENMSINYTGGGAPAFYRSPDINQPNMLGVGDTDNGPESYDIELNFIELEYWISEDFKESNNPWDGYRVDNANQAAMPAFLKAIQDSLKPQSNNVTQQPGPGRPPQQP